VQGRASHGDDRRRSGDGHGGHEGVLWPPLEQKQVRDVEVGRGGATRDLRDSAGGLSCLRVQGEEDPLLHGVRHRRGGAGGEQRADLVVDVAGKGRPGWVLLAGGVVHW
jgi:hypothetical protein